MYSHVPWFLWPIAAVAEVFTNLVKTLIAFFSTLLGMVFIIIGILLSLTLIGAILGVPLVATGVYLLFRSHF